MSLKSAGRFLLIIAVTYTCVAAGFTAIELSKIEREAQFTRETQIPLILSQTRNAVKTERLASLIRALYLARDRRLERQVQLQIQALAQGFPFEAGANLVGGSKRVAVLAKEIAAARQQARDATKANVALFTYEERATAAYGEAIKIVDEMAKELSSDAALVADNITEEIQARAARIRYTLLLTVLVPGAFCVILLLLARRHLAKPIMDAIANLERINGSGNTLPAGSKPVITEIALIGDAVLAYGVTASELRRKNAVLQALAEEDPLTGLANRRTFETFLKSSLLDDSKPGGTALLLIDLDHFKSINDRHGHQVGDLCLQSLALMLTSLEHLSNPLAARYGGEEFVVVYDADSEEQALLDAEFLCRRIASLRVPIADGHFLTLTASIGVAFTMSSKDCQLNEAISRADKALYLAKSSGRNRAVCDKAIARGEVAGEKTTD
ncbi:GGDEF domain-containing protein [Rhizobium grahamii]|uniref:diguanylate cyclase n=1 Tax=Rhizobium grahamii TaxID=1120045 RepID=A0A370KET9_9HYPH|nr:GGDEF domain-containing protein [Rhizobium grahamii]RDJ02726.1 GGDEF domain-containing protein [Rhizobium grahamii]